MTFQVIKPRDLRMVMQQNTCMLIDLREPEEFALGHLAGAVNLCYEQMEQWQYRLSARKLLIFYCEMGGTSMQVARKFALEGYHTASLLGGYYACNKV